MNNITLIPLKDIAAKLAEDGRDRAADAARRGDVEMAATLVPQDHELAEALDAWCDVGHPYCYGGAPYVI